MTPLRRAIDDYLTLRRRLGVTLHETGRVLVAFAAYAERERAEHVTTDLVLRWATVPRHPPANKALQPAPSGPRARPGRFPRSVVSCASAARLNAKPLAGQPWN